MSSSAEIFDFGEISLNSSFSSLRAFLDISLFLRRQGIAVVFFMQFCWIFKINLENPSILCVFFFLKDVFRRWHNTFPFKVPFWEWLAHCPAIEVVRVEIHDVTIRFAGVILRYQRVVCLRVSLAHHRDSTRIPRSTKRCISRSVNKSSSTPSFSRALPMRGLATCNNAPDLTRTALGTGFGSSRKHLPAGRHPFSRKDRDNRPTFCIREPPRQSARARARTHRLSCARRSACCKTFLCPEALFR